MAESDPDLEKTDIDILQERLQNTNLQIRLEETEIKFYRAKEQIDILKQRLADVKGRYKRTEGSEILGMRHSLRIRIMVMKGLISMYHDYVNVTAEEIIKLREESVDSG